MKPRPFDPKRHPHTRRPSHLERLEQASRARRDQLEERARQLAERTARVEAESQANDSHPTRDGSAYCAALAAVPLWRSGEATKLTVSTPYLRLVDIATRCMQNKTRHAVLCWPEFEASPAALAALLALADSAATPAIRHDQLDTRAPPLGLRALIFPYARSAHRPLRHIYVDKDALGRLHTFHQIRATRPGEDQALADYHKTLARTKMLTGKALDGNTYDEFRHPCLDETLPSGPCTGQEGRSELLWRVQTKTDLRKISRSGQADDPATAKFYLFGLRASDAQRPALRALGKRLDIVFLDLSRTSRNRLGRNWPARIQGFLADLDHQIGPVATIALTDDPWTFDRLRFEALRRSSVGKGRAKPEASSIIFAQASELVVTTHPPATDYSELVKQDTIGFSGDVEALLRRIRADARIAAALNDSATVDLLHRMAGIIRRCASLPGSQENLARYLEREVGGLAAADLLASYRVGQLLAELKGALGPWPQHEHAELVNLCTNVERVWNNTAQMTPMAPLLRDIVKKFLRASSRTAVLFRNDMLSDFASHVLRDDDEIGEQTEHRIEKDMLLLIDDGGLDDVTKLPKPERNHIKTLICVAPTRARILSLLARPWLPDNLIVLADSDTLRGAAQDAARLGTYPELAAIHSRMRVFADKASNAVHRLTGASDAVLDDDIADDIEFPVSSVVNLAGHVRPDQPTIRFTLSGDQIVIARPATKLILFDRSRAVPMFTECEAKDVDIGDRVCVIGDAFLQMARPLLNITARAAEEIRDYHQLVVERLARIPAASDHERLERIVAAMALPGVTTQRASYWIDLRQQLEVPLHEVVPHAPRDRATFLAFMRVLGVSEAIASRFWTWAVIAQRTSRVRAAMNFHDAYRTILIDTYAAQSRHPDRVRDIRRLKAAAENFVAVFKMEVHAKCGDADIGCFVVLARRVETR
jgi:hypothetical protein